MLSFFLAALESDADRRSFADLYEEYSVRMERVALHILPEQQDAEDAVQNAFLQVIRHFEKVAQIPHEKLVFWLVAIVKNEAFLILRKKRREAPLEDWERVERAAEDTSGYRELVELFTLLPESCRAVLEMKLLIGYTDQEIAEKLGISKTAVSTRVSRGRAMLRKIAEKEGFHL